MEKLDKLFKIRYDLLSDVRNKEIEKLRYFAIEASDYKKILFYNRK